MAKGKRTKANNEELFPEEPPGPAPDEAVSAWIKSMRLGDVEGAFYWLGLMLEELEIPVGRLARRLGIFGVENVFDLEVAARLAALALGLRFGMVDVNGLWQGTWFACRAKKFWEGEEGREYERLSWQALDAVKNGAPRPVPSYALDAHTARGRARRHAGLPVDGRYSGDRAGRAFMIAQYRRLGRLDPAEGAGDAGPEAVPGPDEEPIA